MDKKTQQFFDSILDQPKASEAEIKESERSIFWKKVLTAQLRLPILFKKGVKSETASDVVSEKEGDLPKASEPHEGEELPK